MSLLAKGPVSIAKILDASFLLLKASFPKIIGFGIFIGLISAGLSISGMLFAQGDGVSGIESSGLLVLFIILVIGFLFFFGLYAAMIYRIDNVANQRNDSFGEAMVIAVRKLPVMLLAAILYSVAMTFGILLLVIPGLILMLSLFFYAYYIVLEDRSAYQSLKASHKLVWKDWWRTLGVFTVPGVLMLIIYFAFGMLMAYTGINENEINWVEVVINLLTGIFTLYFYVLGYVQFHDLKLRKSGSDLEARMAEY